MNSQPIVSIIIPVFNGAEYIRGAVETVLVQTYKNVEMIVVDDGSTDHTKKQIDDYIQSGSVRYIYQTNKGLAGARNTGVKNAKGKFLKFLDCDDFLFDDQIGLQVNHLAGKPSQVISVSDYQLEFESKNRKTVKIGMGQGSQLARFIQSNLGPVHAYLISKNMVEAVGGFDESLSSCEDTDFWLRILLKGGIIERLEYVGCCYRILGQSMSSHLEKHFLQRCKVFEKLNQSLQNRVGDFPQDVRIQLLKTNTVFFHTCFARKMKPSFFIPNAIKMSQSIYETEANPLKKLVLRFVGYSNIERLKYLKKCLSDKNYSSGLLNPTAWRDERNYP